MGKGLREGTARIAVVIARRRFSLAMVRCKVVTSNFPVLLVPAGGSSSFAATVIVLNIRLRDAL